MSSTHPFVRDIFYSILFEPPEATTLRILRLASSIKGLELKNLPPLSQENEIANSLRAASQATDTTRRDNRRTIQCQQGTKEYDKLVRHHCKPLQYSNTLLKHLAPLWETWIHKWSKILTIDNKFTSDTRLYIQQTEALLARLPNRKHKGLETQIRTCMDTLKSTLLLPADTPHRKLPTNPTNTSTLFHHTRHAHIPQHGIPEHIPASYASLNDQLTKTTRILKRSNTPPAQPAASPHHTAPTPLDIITIDGHRHLLQNTIYRVNQWKPEILTLKQFCRHADNGLKPKSSFEPIRKTKTPRSFQYSLMSIGNRLGWWRTLYSSLQMEQPP
jgi:hypothetical protein